MPPGHSPILFIPLFMFFFASTIGWGAFLLRVTGLWKRMPDLLHILFFSGILGVLFMGDLILLAGLLGRLEQSVLAFLFLPGFIFCCHSLSLGKISRREVSAAIRMDRKDGGVSPQPGSFPFRYFFILCAPFVLIIFLHALVPDVSGDAYLYHITVPNYYALEGRIARVPISFCYNYPLQMEMYYIAGIRFGQEQAGVMMNFALVLLTCAGIYLLGKKLGSPASGLKTIFLFLSMPIVLIWAPTSLVDISTGTFLVGSLVCLFYWKSSHEPLWLLLAGICAGGAVTIKLFVAVASCVIFPLAIGATTGKIVWERIREHTPPGSRVAGSLFMTRFTWIFGRNLTIYVAGAIVPLIPWMMKNALLTNNPFFPFFSGLFPTRPDLISSAHVLFKMHGLPHFEGIPSTLQRIPGLFPLLRWDANWLIIISLFLVPLTFLLSLKNKKMRLWSGIQCLIVLFMLYYGKMAQVRWHLGFFPVLLLGFVLTTEQLIERRSTLRRIITVLFFVFILLIWGRQYQLRLRETNLYPWTGLSRKTLGQYLKDQDRVKEAKFLNALVPEHGKVFLFDMEILSPGRWMRRRFVQAGSLWFERWEAEKAKPRDILKDLKDMGATHIAAIPFKNKTFQDFQRSHLKEMASGTGYTIYEIVPGK